MWTIAYVSWVTVLQELTKGAEKWNGIFGPLHDCIHAGETPCEFIHLDCHHNDVLLIKRNSWGALYYE